MRFRPTRLAAGLLVTLLGLAPGAQAQEMTPPQPTKEHALLSKDVGIWDAAMKAWMGPGDPIESKGIETNRMLGGLWLISEYDGDFAGMKFQGHGQSGYDPLTKKYVGTWVDTFSTTPIAMVGTYDEKTGELSMIGETVDPASGTKMPMKNISKHNADGTRMMTMYMKDASSGEWVKSMELTYTLRKSAAK